MKKKILIILLILIFLYCIGGVIYSVVVSGNSNEENNLNTVLTIINYGYEVDENVVSSLYKNEFNILKNNLESDEINYDEYIKSIAKLYIIDLYSLEDKMNKYDVTSIQYVNEESKENFKLKVSETIYKYIEDNTDNGRKQELPRVAEVIIKDVENTTYTIESMEYEAYNVNIEWIYEKDLGYDTSAVLTLIKNENIVSVVEEKRINEIEDNVEITT